MKARDKKVVCKSFHSAGIVVPVDDNEVGYRPVPESVGMWVYTVVMRITKLCVNRFMVRELFCLLTIMK